MNLNLQQFLQKQNQDTLEKLAQAKTANQLRESLTELGHTFTEEESKAAFAALYPLRDGGISDDALEEICGGRRPGSSPSPPWRTSGDMRLRDKGGQYNEGKFPKIL